MNEVITKKLLLAVFLVAGCFNPVQDFRDTTVELHSGGFSSEGSVTHDMVQSYKGEIVRQINAEINAPCEEKHSWLDEKPFLDNGEQEKCDGKRKKAGNQYTISALNVVDIAIEAADVSVLILRYTPEHPVSGKTREVNFDGSTSYTRKAFNESDHYFTTGRKIQL